MLGKNSEFFFFFKLELTLLAVRKFRISQFSLVSNSILRNYGIYMVLSQFISGLPLLNDPNTGDSAMVEIMSRELRWYK